MKIYGFVAFCTAVFQGFSTTCRLTKAPFQFCLNHTLRIRNGLLWLSAFRARVPCVSPRMLSFRCQNESQLETPRIELWVRVYFLFLVCLFIYIYIYIYIHVFVVVFVQARKMQYFTAFSHDMNVFYNSPSTSPASQAGRQVSGRQKVWLVFRCGLRPLGALYCLGFPHPQHHQCLPHPQQHQLVA